MEQISKTEKILRQLEGKGLEEVFGILDGIENLDDDTLRMVIDVKYTRNTPALRECYRRWGDRLVSKSLKDTAEHGEGVICISTYESID